MISVDIQFLTLKAIWQSVMSMVRWQGFLSFDQMHISSESSEAITNCCYKLHVEGLHEPYSDKAPETLP